MNEKELKKLADLVIEKGTNSRGEKCYYAYFGKIIIDVVRNSTTQTMQAFDNLQRFDLTKSNLDTFLFMIS